MRKTVFLLLALTVYASVFFMGQETKAGMVETSPDAFEFYEEVDLVQVILGGDTSYALTEDGRLFGWGYNGFGVIGDGTNIDKLSPVEVTHNFELNDFEKIIDADFGDRFSVVLTSLGRVFTWGDSSNGQLGNGVSDDTYIPIDITGNFSLDANDKVINIEVGVNHTFALTESGQLFAWGSNSYGKIGDGTEEDQYLPINITESIGLYYYETIDMISLGSENSMIVSSEGRLIAWGDNGEGQLGVGTTTNILDLIDVSSTMGLNDDEKIMYALSGYGTSMATTSEGRVFTWGNNEYGQLADGTMIGKTTPVDVTASFDFAEDEYIVQADSLEGFTIAFTNQNRLFTWGYNDDGQLGTGDYEIYTIPQDITAAIELYPTEEIINVSASWTNSALLTNTGRCMLWGYNGDGQIGDGERNDSLIPIEIQEFFNITRVIESSLDYDETIVDTSMGRYHYSAVTSYGRLFTWGDNRSGQLGDGTLINTNIPIDITDSFNLSVGENIVEVDLGGYHSVARTSNGRVFAWGQNDHGQLGVGSVVDSSVPVELPASSFDSETVVSIEVYEGQNAAFTSTGKLFVWGYNELGQLGTGTAINQMVPIEVTSNFSLAVDESIEKISFGYYHTGAISSEGRLFLWGYNSYGELGNGTTSIVTVTVPTELPLSNFDGHPIADVSANYHSTAVVTDTGRLYTWGYNGSGQLGYGNTTNSSIPVEVPLSHFDDESIEDIEMGFQFATAITSSATLYTWGQNNDGQLANGTVNPEYLPQAVPLFDGTEDIAYVSPGRQGALAITDNGMMYRWGRTSIGAIGNEDSYRDLQPLQKFDMNIIQYLYTPSKCEYYSDVILVSIFPSFDIGDQLFSITINGVEYEADDFTVSNGRIDVNLDNTGVMNEVFDIVIDSISYVDGVQTQVTGYTAKSVILEDLEAPSFDAIDSQTLEAVRELYDWTTVIENLEDNSNTEIIIDVESDIVSYGNVGSYTVTITATDASMNETSQTFDVEIVDTTPPVITVTGDVLTYHEVNTNYHDRGARFSDNADDPGNAFTSGDTVDSSTVGTYILYYNVSDSSGNEAVTVSRTVIVQDTIAPVVSGVVNDEVYEKGSEVTITFDDGTATLNDEEFTSGSVISEAGDYTLVVTDMYGNATTTIFTIEGSNTVMILIIVVAVIAVAAGGFLLGKKYLSKV